jgi:hypothetical protein
MGGRSADRLGVRRADPGRPPLHDLLAHGALPAVHVFQPARWAVPRSCAVCPGGVGAGVRDTTPAARVIDRPGVCGATAVPPRRRCRIGPFSPLGTRVGRPRGRRRRPLGRRHPSPGEPRPRLAARSDGPDPPVCRGRHSDVGGTAGGSGRTCGALGRPSSVAQDASGRPWRPWWPFRGRGPPGTTRGPGRGAAPVTGRTVALPRGGRRG